jgi:tetratricopeptide (TPR) repeat protein
MAKSEIRKVITLPEVMVSKTVDLQETALKFLPDNIHKAVITIKSAWDLLPEPKFNTSVSDAILSDYIYILNFALKHAEAIDLLKGWITVLENDKKQQQLAIAYILMGETLLLNEEPEEAKRYFQKALHIGSALNFDDKPALYLAIATGKVTGTAEITQAFEQLDLLEVWMDKASNDNIGRVITNDILKQIDEICEEGSELFDEEEYEKAIAVWERAFLLIPEPRNNYSQTLWLHSSIGDSFFLLGDFKRASAHFFAAKSNTAADGYSNPFIMLRLGQSYLELNDTNNAKEYLLRAYMLEGKDLFESEPDKYFDFLRKHVKL